MSGEEKKEEPTGTLAEKDEVPVVRVEVEKPSSKLSRIEEEPEVETTAAAG